MLIQTLLPPCEVHKKVEFRKELFRPNPAHGRLDTEEDDKTGGNIN